MALALRLTLWARWPAKSSVQSWFSGIEALFLEILGPLFELRPVEAGEVGVAFHLRDGADQEQQVAALLDGHLVVLAALAAAIDLAVGVRIGAEVVRREGELPALARGVVHERHEERLGQRRAEEQELRRHRIEHVRGADAAVGVVLLAELERLAVGVGDELARGEALAIGERAELGVFLAAGLG